MLEGVIYPDRIILFTKPAFYVLRSSCTDMPEQLIEVYVHIVVERRLDVEIYGVYCTTTPTKYHNMSLSLIA